MPTKRAYGVSDVSLSHDGKTLHISQAESGMPVEDHPDRLPFFHGDLPHEYKRKIVYTPAGENSRLDPWQAGVSVPVSIAAKHPPLAAYLEEAEERHDPGLWKKWLGKKAHVVGSMISTTIKRPAEPVIHAVKTEGPLGEMLKRMLPETSTTSMLGNLLPSEGSDGSCCPTCNCDPCCCQHVEVLKKLSSKKYQLILAYIHYGDQLRAMYRDGIYEHFQGHLEEERAQLYQINKKITAMGSDAPCTPGPVPPVPLDNARAIFKTLLPIEEESVSLWSKLFHETEDDVALNGMAQAYATECKGHADDLRRYLRSCE